MMIDEETEKRIGLRFPGLTFEPGLKLLKGVLSFEGHFNPDTGFYSLFDPSPHEFYIKDEYQVEIRLPDEGLPYRTVKEIGKKIERLAERLKRDVSDFHSKTNGEVCINGHLSELHDISIEEFLVEKVAAFFYDVSFFAKFRYWPRGEYSHFVLGMLEEFGAELERGETKSKFLTTNCLSEIAHFAALAPKEALYVNGSLPKNKALAGFDEIRMRLQSETIPEDLKCPHCFEALRTEMKVCHPVAFEGLIALNGAKRTYGLKHLLTL